MAWKWTSPRAFRAIDTAADLAKHHKAVTAHPKGDRDMVTDLDIEIERGRPHAASARRTRRGVPRRGGKPSQ